MIQDHGYFAGFFDADGSVAIRPHPTCRYTLDVRVSNTNFEILDLFQKRYGGSVQNCTDREGCKPVRVWLVAQQKAEDFLLAVLPYLVVKRERAELALEFREAGRQTKLPRGRFANSEQAQRTRDRAIAERADFHARMATLNRRGVLG